MNRAQVVHEHPETWPYLLEDGCDVAEECARCPLRQCRLDDHHWFNRAKAYARAHLIVQARDRYGGSAESTAARLGVELSSVYRAQKRLDNDPAPLTRAELEALIPLVELPSCQPGRPVPGAIQVRLC